MDQYVLHLLMGSLLAGVVWFVKKELSANTKNHEKHFAHAADADIHQKTMSEKLIQSELSRIHQRIDDLGKLVDTRFDNMCDRITDLADTIRKGSQ